MIFGPYDLMFMIPALIITIWSQIKLHSTYSRFSQVEAASGLTGAEVARYILDREGLQTVPVREVEGHLTDHYDPRDRSVNLSTDIFHGTSLAAVGVAAHETGHAIQHKVAYAPMNLRMAIIPVTQFGSAAAPLIFMVGLFMQLGFLMSLAIWLFSAFVLFQLITLPVEYDASSRAKKHLAGMGILSADEATGVRKVLSAAALTYVAGLLVSVLELSKWIFLANRSSHDD
ncbi:MAG: zinc metallopeptidase [Verrucomicrobia bacterium]|nr:zinc metallopeptidase [Verrucomicrobiota bacterium]